MQDDIKTKTTNQPNRNSSQPEPTFTSLPEKSPSPDITTDIGGRVSLSSSKRKGLKNLTKKQKIIVAVIAGVLLVGGGLGAYFVLKPDKKINLPIISKDNTPPPKTTEPSKLTGLEVNLDVNKKPVIAIMIENSPDARPQSGLKDAGIVYEAIAEGGITRFSALFLDNAPEYIGPVRSVRPYYLDFVTPFAAPIAHVGGSPEALAQIRSQGLRDLDQFSNSSAYWRENSRYAPHNMYTSLSKLLYVAKSKGYDSTPITSFPRKAKEEPVQQNQIKNITIAISSALYNVAYRYDSASNSYLRELAGQKHVDAKSGIQLSPKSVVALVMPQGANGKYTTYQTNGQGKMFVFQDGKQINGTWQKTDRASQFVFKDEQGNELKLNPGQTWVTIVGSPTAVTAAP